MNHYGIKKMIKVEDVTRFEVIDNTGRAYVKYGVKDIEMSFQDNCKTLKIFVEYEVEEEISDD